MNGLRCPACRGRLLEDPAEYRCVPCARVYPLIAGIPDFRLCADPYISIEADREKAMHLAERAHDLSFFELLAYYYEITPEVSPELALRYAAHQSTTRERASGVLHRLERRFGRAPAEGERLLDLGCGLAGLVVETTGLGSGSVGVDIALRWLVVARALLEESGAGDTRLYCACADHLPFDDASFDWVVAEGLLEHLPTAGKVLSEAMRVLSSQGSFMARTVNRLALGPEPHLQLWWAGYLPQPWRDHYALWRRGRDYSRLHLRSLRQLRRVTAEFAGQLEVVSPLLLESDLVHHSGWRRRLLLEYSRMLRWPLVGKLAWQVGPYLDLVSRQR